ANGVAVGTLVTLGTSPLWAGLFEWLLRSHPPGRSWLGATGLAVFGVTLLTGANGTADPSGLLLSVAAGAAYGLELVLIKVPLDRGWNASDAVSWVMGLAAVMAVPVLLTTDLGWIQHGRGVAVVAWLAVVTIVISYQLVAAGLKRLSAATVTTLTMAEPATATLLGLILLNESLSVTGVLGLTAIIGGLVVLTASAPVSTEG
ncbi:MAG: DMT family transporter, partial [Propionibacteriaceae bacterium]|nr:DMT family transporter [Propionibacteriaceae bacterium]